MDAEFFQVLGTLLMVLGQLAAAWVLVAIGRRFGQWLDR